MFEQLQRIEQLLREQAPRVVNELERAVDALALVADAADEIRVTLRQQRQPRREVIEQDAREPRT